MCVLSNGDTVNHQAFEASTRTASASAFSVRVGNVGTGEDAAHSRHRLGYVQLSCLQMMDNLWLLEPITLDDLRNKMLHRELVAEDSSWQPRPCSWRQSPSRWKVVTARASLTAFFFFALFLSIIIIRFPSVRIFTDIYIFFHLTSHYPPL
jgi:hypothetical protein